MVTGTDTAKPPIDLTIDIDPNPVPAGRPARLRARLRGDAPPDLRGLSVDVRDTHGQRVAGMTFDYFDGKECRSDHAAVVAPTALGAHAWTAVVPAQERRGVPYPERRFPVTMTVVANPIRVSAWDLPSAAVAGEVATVHVGAKGGHDDALAGRPFEVLDEHGERVAEGRLGSEPWRGTRALYAASVGIPTPAEPGLRRWRVVVPGFEAPAPHDAGEARLSFPTVAAPDGTVTVRVVDHETRRPLPAAQVVLHPFRGTTDVDGIARVRAGRGEYTLFVSAPRHEVYRIGLRVDGDTAVDAELIAETEPDIGDLYA